MMRSIMINILLLIALTFLLIHLISLVLILVLGSGFINKGRPWLWVKSHSVNRHLIFLVTEGFVYNGLFGVSWNGIRVSLGGRFLVAGYRV